MANPVSLARPDILPCWEVGGAGLVSGAGNRAALNTELAIVKFNEDNLAKISLALHP